MLRDPSLIPLSHQHHNALALCVLTERSLRNDRSSENVARLARRAADRYDIELTNHFAIEEQILFPSVETHLGTLPLIGELVAQHRQIELLIGQIRTSPSVALLEGFCALLSKHIRLEENELFQEIQQRLPREELERLGKEIDVQVVRVCL